jgi:excinuclease ABC subunit C
VLKTIKGVGEKTEQRLLLRFGSVARIASAPIEEVAELVGKSLAEKIMKELNKKDE